MMFFSLAPRDTGAMKRAVMPDRNPVTYHLAPDETLWMYQGNTDDLRSLLENPDLWVKEHIKTCEPPPSGVYIVEFSTQPTSLVPDLNFFGTCGTSVIYVSGRENIIRLMSKSERAFIAEDFWSGMDGRLASINGSTEIEIFLMPQNGRAFIHFESGTDRLFHAQFMCAATLDQKGYLDWVMGGPKPELPRKFVMHDQRGVATSLASNQVVLQPRGTQAGTVRDIRMMYQSLSVGDGMSGPEERACNGTHGRIVHESGSKFYVEPDFMFTKPYPLRRP